MGAASAPTPYIWSTRVPVWMYGELTSGSTPRDPHWRVYVPKEAAVKTTDLDAFFDHGWNAHDVDALMTFMTNDCVLESASGPDAYGTRHEGREHVRAAFARIFSAFPDVRFVDVRHVVAGARGVSEWIFRGTSADALRGVRAWRRGRALDRDQRAGGRLERDGNRPDDPAVSAGPCRSGYRVARAQPTQPTPAGGSAICWTPASNLSQWNG